MADDLVAGRVEDRDLALEDRDERIRRVADPKSTSPTRAVRSSPSSASRASCDAESVGLAGAATAFEPTDAPTRSRSSSKNLEQSLDVVGAAVDDSVDEQRRRSHHLARGFSACAVALDSLEHLAAARSRSNRAIEPDLVGVGTQVVVLERVLAPEEQVVHLPEAALQRGRLGRRGCRERVRVDLDEWEVPEHEPDATGSPPFTFSIARNACREYGHS